MGTQRGILLILVALSILWVTRAVVPPPPPPSIKASPSTSTNTPSAPSSPQQSKPSSQPSKPSTSPTKPSSTPSSTPSQSSSQPSKPSPQPATTFSAPSTSTSPSSPHAPTSAPVNTTSPPQNFLFIAVDDLRAELGAYGYDYMLTPNFDHILGTAVSFRRMFVQFPVCGPSRTSMLTGRRPDTTHVTDLTTYFRAAGCNVTTLPQYFRRRGYYVAGSGKIFHPRQSSGLGYYPNNTADDPPSWTVPFHIPEGDIFRALYKSWWSGYAEGDHPDAKTAEYIIERMAHASQDLHKPFFLMAGFEKPHLPFVMPTEYLDMYPLANVSMPDDYEEPDNFPKVAWNAGGIGEFKLYSDVKALNLSRGMDARFSDSRVLNYRRAYRACVTFVDAQIGKLLAAINHYGLTSTTTIVLWSDHGFLLGDHAAWGKHSAFENNARVPFSIRSPKHLKNSGKTSYKIVESIDIFPTLVDLAGFPIPIGLQGKSLVPLLDDPNDERWNTNVALTQVDQEYNGQTIMGYSLRTQDWRYTEYAVWNETTWLKDWNRVPGFELYDHRGDTGVSLEAWENINLYNVPPYNAQVKALSATLRAMVDRNTRPLTEQCTEVFDPTQMA